MVGYGSNTSYIIPLTALGGRAAAGSEEPTPPFGETPSIINYFYWENERLVCKVIFVVTPACEWSRHSVCRGLIWDYKHKMVGIWNGR